MTYRIEKLCETTEEARTFVQAGELRMAVIEMLEELRRTCKHFMMIGMPSGSNCSSSDCAMLPTLFTFSSEPLSIAVHSAASKNAK